MTLEDFLASRGIARPSEPGMHCGAAHVGKSTRRAQMRLLAEKLDAYGKARDAATAEYDALVTSGHIVPPTRTERLKRAANGHPDRQDTQAARRLLEREGITW